MFTIPVVTRAFGPELFGFVVTATAASAYVALLMNFGFGWSGPRLVTQLRDDANLLSANVSAVIAAQLALGLLGSVVYVVWTLHLGEQRDLRLAQWVILVTAILNALVPAWLFQGLERMRELVLPQLLARIAATAAIVALVRSAADLLLYVVISAAASAAGLLMFLRLMAKLGVRLRRPPPALIRERLRESSSLFVSNAAISFYTTANVLIVSLLLGNHAAGIFGLADRIRQASVSAFVPLTQAIYPFVCRTVGSNDPGERLARRRLFQIMLGVAAAAGIATFIVAPWAVALLGGARFEQATTLVRIFSLVPLIVVSTNILGVQMMLPLGMDRALAVVVSLCAFIGLVLQVVFTRALGVSGSAWAYVIVEVAVCCGFIIALTMHRNRRRRAPITRQ